VPVIDDLDLLGTEVLGGEFPSAPSPSTTTGRK
jgi:hypothetical protein